jgi:MATE family multidrug resistance protein
MSRKLAAQIYTLAWPVLVAQLAVMGYSVVDTLMAGRYSTEDLAAVGIGASIYVSVLVTLMGVLLALTPTVAQLRGAKAYDQIGEQVRQSMWLALMLAIFAVIVFHFPEPLLALSKPAPAVADKVRAYLAIAAWGAPAGLAFRLFASYTTAVSLPRVMMVLNVIGLLLKVSLNWIFIFGHLGVSPMGASGCALSTTLVNTFIAALAWLWCAVAPAYRHNAVFTRWSWPRWEDQRRLIALGAPIGITFLVDVTAFTFMALFIARLGATHSAAHQIAANVAATIFMVPLAMGNAVSVLVGQAIGARDFDRARSMGITGILIAVGIAASAGVLLSAGAVVVGDIYTTDRAVRTLAASLLAIVAVYHVFDALQAVTVSALRGYKRTVVPMVCNVLGLWTVGLAGGYVLGLTDIVDLTVLGLPTPLLTRGFWIAAATGMAVSGLGVLAYFLVVSADERARMQADRVRPLNAA